MKKEESDHLPLDNSRREALAKLAKLSVYTAPSVMALLASTQTHAQTSSTAMNLNNGQIMNICMSTMGNFGSFWGLEGNDSGWDNASDTPSDCGM